mgnify:CR=1 FL=1|jgi:hypothetical protein
MSTVNQSQLYTQLHRQLHNQSASYGAGAFPEDPVAHCIAKSIASVYGPVVAALETRIVQLESRAASHTHPGPNKPPAS